MSYNFVRNLIIRRIFSVDKEGMKLFGNISYITLQARSMAIFLQEIGNKKGEDYLYKLGYEAGWDAAEDMIKYMKLPVSMSRTVLKHLQPLLEVIGFGRFEFLLLKPKEGKILLRVKDHPVIEAAKLLFGSKSHICAFYRGVYAAHGEREVGIKNCNIKETFCITKGKPFCEWTSGLG